MAGGSSTKNTTDRVNLRAQLLGQPPKRRETVITLKTGEEIVIRQPTVGERAEIFKRAGITAADPNHADLGELQVWSVIYCAYTKDGERLFDEADYEALINSPVGGLVDRLAAEAMSIMNASSDQGKS